MSTGRVTGLTYDDLESFPDDGLRRELIVSPSPRLRHQLVGMELAGLLWLYTKEHGGVVICAPMDVYFAHDEVVEPDVLFVLAEHLDRVEDRFVRGAPDIVVEVSSPSTRHLELVRKRNLYERYGVPEYWYVDLDTDALHVYRLVGGAYGDQLFRRVGCVGWVVK